MFSVLYTLVIYPIELFLEVIFSVIYDFRPSACLAIIGVSLVLNFLLLPLYNRADRISQEERQRQDSMQNWVKHIRNSFTGDERFMMLQAYYRKQDYHPLYSLRSSISLLLQIPFFIAAYHFLSHLRLLQGYPFHIIRDLGKPDGLIVIGTLSVNLLPILMTGINIISIIIYTKGSTLREKLQLYIMAGLFLILLYDSPSGLVIYWTMNNIFSLVKNIVLNAKSTKGVNGSEKKSSVRDDGRIYMKGVIMLTILIGLAIPLSVIVSSPEEFVILTAYRNPLHYAFNALLIAAGTFLLWFSVFYYLSGSRGKQVFTFAIWLCCGMALVDFLLFGKIPLTLSPEMVYRGELVYSSGKIFVNIIVLAMTFIIMSLIWRYRHGWINNIYKLIIAVLVILSVFNTVSTQRKLSVMSYLRNDTEYEGFTLSKNGKNVIVLMLDCAIGPYIPYIMEERPELREKYDGFTYYVNIISHGEHTIVGAPGIFGGYEYTPEAMNNRPEEKLVDKHNEALSVMPVLFSDNGFETTVYDPPLAGYEDVSDLSIYDKYPKIHAYSLKNRFASSESISYTDSYRKRQIFMYGIFKSVPVFMQSFIYRGGTYHSPDTFNVTALENVNSEFNDSYSILGHLTELTEISDASSKNTFMMMDNDTTHDPRELQLPNYDNPDNVDNSGLEEGFRVDSEGNVLKPNYIEYYHVNMAAMLKVAEWLDYLRDNGVYDNTRIIIVSDHGAGIGDFGDRILDSGLDTEGFSALLMFKDFDSHGFNEDDGFMTNADTPMLASRGVIDNNDNPFTGRRLDDSEKSHEQLVLASNFSDFDANVFTDSEQGWYQVKDDMRGKNNWKKIPALH